MFITTVPNRGSPPASLLRGSYREDGKVRSCTMANLSSWPEEKVETLRAPDKTLRITPNHLPRARAAVTPAASSAIGHSV